MTRTVGRPEAVAQSCDGLRGLVKAAQAGVERTKRGAHRPQSLMVETDAPFLLPRDLRVRDRRNEPS